MLAVVLAITGAVLAVWFWPHCARPALKGRRAGALTTGLVLGLTVVFVLGQVLLVGLAIAGLRSPLAYLVTGLPYVVVVGLGYFVDEYATLLRLTRGR
jgi:hypothetical protein